MATRRTTGSVRTAESSKPAPEKIAPQQRTEAGKPAAPSGAATRNTVSEDARRAMVAQAAYLRAERRGFAPETIKALKSATRTIFYSRLAREDALKKVLDELGGFAEVRRLVDFIANSGRGVVGRERE